MPLTYKAFLSAFFGCYFFIAFTPMASAKNHLLVFGGGGEPKDKPGTIFDKGLQGIADYTKRSPEVMTEVAFNGGHPETEDILNNRFSGNIKKSPFEEADYKRLIQSYISKLQNKELVKGDQLMIMINTHGAEKQPQFKTHSIATSVGNPTNLNSLQGAHTVDLDQLEVLKNLAKAQGVKMAIVDNSCHSGNSLSLADENTCVITASGPNHYGFAPFSENFIELMQNGKNLEDVFLEARAMDQTPSFPMISTPQGLKANALLYENMTPFLYYDDPKYDKLTPYLQAHSDERQMCLSEENFLSLLQTIDKIEETYTTTKKILWWTKTKKNLDLKPLKILLTQQQNALKEITKQMQDLKGGDINTLETITPKVDFYISPSVKMPQISWGDLIKTDYDRMISSTSELLKNETDPYQIPSHKWNLSIYTQAKAKKEEILAKNPKLLSLTEKQKGLKKSILLNFETVQKIALEERKLYQAIYKDQPQKVSNNNSNSNVSNIRDLNLSKDAANSQNACQSFKL